MIEVKLIGSSALHTATLISLPYLLIHGRWDVAPSMCIIIKLRCLSRLIFIIGLDSNQLELEDASPRVILFPAVYQLEVAVV